MAKSPTQHELNVLASKDFKSTAVVKDGIHVAPENYYPGILKHAGTTPEQAAMVHSADIAAAVGPAMALVDMVKDRTAGDTQDWKPVRATIVTPTGNIELKAQPGAGINKPDVKIVRESNLGDDSDFMSALETIKTLVKPKAEKKD